MDPNLPAVYLASPLGFTPYGSRYQRELGEMVERSGCRLLDPWASEEGLTLGRLIAAGATTETLREANARVAAANIEMIRSCHAILACLDGTGVDDGTASEIGFGAGIGRVVVGFRTDLRLSGDNHATPVNLQVAYLITNSGGEIFDDPEQALQYLLVVFARTTN